VPGTDRFDRYSRLHIEQRPNGVMLITLSSVICWMNTL